jgi:hypothetical protein
MSGRNWFNRAAISFWADRTAVPALDTMLPLADHSEAWESTCLERDS